MSKPNRYENSSSIKGAVIFLLAIVTLMQLIWPITHVGRSADGVDNPIMVLIYQFLYMTLMIAGIIVARDNHFLSRALALLGFGWIVTGIVYAFNQTASWALMTGYAMIALFQMMVVYILIRFIFTARTITRDVLYAACAIYLLLGSIFVPIYGLIESATFFPSGGVNGGIHAFSDGSIQPGEIFPWQTFIYFSYVTLTTLGYGDILPVNGWARSAVTTEAIIGVLYITVIMARLVGLYATQEIEEEILEIEELPDDSRS